MTPTLLERAELAEDADLRRRLRQALAMVAATVAAEPAPEDPEQVGRHQARLSLAVQVSRDPNSWVKSFAVGVANNPNVGQPEDDPTANTADGDDALLWVVTSLWDTFTPNWGT